MRHPEPSTHDPGRQAVAARIAAVCEEWRSAIGDPRTDARVQRRLRPGLRLGVETIREGWALHHETSHVLAAGSSPALRLLVGDWCYAAGLCDVAELGDLDAVATLASIITDAAILAGSSVAGSSAAAAQRWNDGLAELAEDLSTPEE